MKRFILAAAAVMMLAVPVFAQNNRSVEDPNKDWLNLYMLDPTLSGSTWTIDSTGTTITDTSAWTKIHPEAEITTWISTGVITDSVSFYLQVSHSIGSGWVTMDSLVMEDSVLNVKKWLATAHVTQPVSALFIRWIGIIRSDAAGEAVVTGRIIATKKP